MIIRETSCAALLEDARRRFFAGRYDEALELLVSCEDWEGQESEDGVLLRADILSRRNPLDALKELVKYQDIFTTDNGRFRNFVALARAHANTRNFPVAEAMLAEAKKFWDAVGQGARSAHGLEQARQEWLNQRFDPASQGLAEAFKDDSPRMQILATQLRGWMHAGGENYNGLVEDLLRALEIGEKHQDQCEAHILANTTSNCLRMAFETANHSAMEQAHRMYRQIDWTSDLHVDRFLAMRPLAWHAFLNGEPTTALRLLKEARDVAPTDPWRVVAHLDRAYMADFNHNELWAAEELYEAHAIAQRVSWTGTIGEERFALVVMGTLFAKYDMAIAQSYLSEYKQMGLSGVRPSISGVSDRRAVAFEEFASGRVHMMLGAQDLAAKQIESAYEIFAKIGYEYRASLAADAMFSLTNSPVWEQRRAKHLEHFPESPLFIESGATKTQDELLGSLTAMQQQVFRAICEGLSAKEISDRFNRSIFTINKHVQAVYTAFNVHSRNELRAEARTRGLL